MSEGLISGSADAGASNGGAASAVNAMNGANGQNGTAAPNGTQGNPRVSQGSNSGGAFDKDGNWRSFFSQGLDEETAKDWDSFSSRIQAPQELAKSYVHAQKELRNRVKVPGEGAKDEDWDQFYSKVRPETPDKYQFTDPKEFELTDTDKQYRDGFRGVAHRIGLSQRQLSQLESWQYEQNKLQIDAMNAAAQTAKARTVKGLKSKWSIDFDANLKGANNVLAHYGGQHGPELANLRLADGTPLSAHQGFIEMLAAIHADRAEDGVMPNAFTAEKRQGALEQIKAVEDEAAKAGITPTDKRYPHDKLEKLYQQAYPQRSGRRQPFGAA
jgi:hypothetical protein